MLRKLFSAIFGFLLFPMAKILSLIITIVVLPFTIIATPFQAAFLLKALLNAKQISLGIFPFILLSTFVVTPVLLIITVVSTLLNIIIFPFKFLYQFWNGMRCGWNEGASSVLSKAGRLVLKGCTEEQNGNLPQAQPNRQAQANRQEQPAVQPRAIANPLANLRDRPMTLAEYHDLSSRVPDVQNYCESLTQEQKEQCMRNPHPDWESYKNLERLDSEEEICSLTQVRPVTKSIIVLFKQYQFDARTWKTVPNAVHIFDKDDLNRNFLNYSSKHPITRESVLSPPAYKGKTTRYAIHPYATEEGKTISLERHALTLSLREHLTKGGAVNAFAPLMSGNSSERQQDVFLRNAQGIHYDSPLETKTLVELVRPSTPELEDRIAAAS